jgi:hypothetical protein
MFLTPYIRHLTIMLIQGCPRCRDHCSASVGMHDDAPIELQTTGAAAFGFVG